LKKVREELMKRTSSTEGNGKETGRTKKAESELENEEPDTATSDDDEAEVDSDDDEAIVASLGPESWDNPETSVGEAHRGHEKSIQRLEGQNVQFRPGPLNTRTGYACN